MDNQSQDKYIKYLEGLLNSNGINFQMQVNDTASKEKVGGEVHFETNIKNLLSYEQIERYKRQMLLPEIKFEGQVKLAKSRVLVVGLGGIGGPASLYLAGAGIGCLGLIDGDKVEVSNLHRQIIHTTNRVGINKCLSAMEQIRQFNNLVKVETHEFNLTQDNATQIISQYDIVLDASDNSLTRYLVNDACVILGKPLISGAAVQWEGQLSVFNYNGPCYRCLYPECPKGVKNCSDAGVFGVLPGLIGLLEALETIKLIIGQNVLSKKMVLIDGLSGSYKTVTIRDRQVTCAVCGTQPTIKDVREFDYKSFTGSCAVVIPASDKYKNIDWKDLQERLQQEKDATLIDCRPKEQFDVINLEIFKNLPWGEIKLLEDQELFNQVEKSDNHTQNTYIMCRRGNMSRLMCDFLAEKGYQSLINYYINIQDLYNVIGGINMYAKDYDQDMPLL